MGKRKISNNISIPMPIGIVGSLNKGKPNFMAVGWVSRVNNKPPMIGVSIGQHHLTHDCIIKNGCFSLNMPGKNLLIPTDYIGLVSGDKVDKSAIFEIYYGVNKDIPLIKEAAVSLECQVTNTVKLPTNTFFIGEVTSVWCEEEYINNDNPDYQKAQCYFMTMPDNTYWGFGENIGKAWSIGMEFKKP
jgi:flavin reductase (DIM6/NTAB) family NADH-FMN oxidoreductase RutF